MSGKKQGRGRGRPRPQEGASNTEQQRLYESEEPAQESRITTQVAAPPPVAVAAAVSSPREAVPIVEPPKPQGLWGKKTEATAAPAPVPAPVSQISSIEQQQQVASGKQAPAKQQQPPPPKAEPKPPTQPPPPTQPQQSSIESMEGIVEKLKSSVQLTTPPTPMTIPGKPKDRCSLGREILLRANHYGVYIDKPITVYHYDVQITRSYVDKAKKQVETEVDSKEISKKVFQELLRLNPIYAKKLFYDFRKSLYSIDKLSEPFEKTVPNIEGKEYVIKFRLAKDISRTIQPNQPANDVELQVTLQILQIMVTHTNSLKLINIDRSFYPKECAKHALGINVNLWKGFYSSIRPSEMGFNINIDVANAVFFEEGKNLVDLAMMIYECRNMNDLLGWMKKDKGNDFINTLKGKKVKTHMNYTKKVEGLGPTPNGHVFEHNGKKLTITQYFKEVHNVTLRYPDLPCVCLGKQNYTPMELCTTELSNMKKLPAKMTADMIRATAVPCFNRRTDIENLVVNSGIKSDPILQQFNIRTELKMVEIKGRVVEPPDLQYNGMKLDSKVIGTKGQWDNTRKRFFAAKELADWTVVYFSDRIRHDEIGAFLDGLMNTAETHGLRVKDPLDCVYCDPRMNSNQVRDFLGSLVKKHNNQVRLILAILHKENATNIYNALKTFGDCLTGIRTQALDVNSITKCRGQYARLASNLCLKINSKLGGTNFTISKENRFFQQYLQGLYNGPLMIIGADVNHPSPGDGDTTESIAAAVGSIDKDCCYYAARILCQKQMKGQALELIYDLAVLVRGLLKEYHKANKVFPRRIVFLRDGVSEGQFSKMGHEIQEIRKACADVCSDYKPGLTFLVVQKRHHTRLFPSNKADESGRHGNVPPGTVVDTKIITPNMFDFFLCSHMGIQGTSKPCHYFVLHDDNNFSMNAIVLLCHYLCHIYSRSTTSVSYPAPTYYADLCAERGRIYLGRKKMPEPNQANPIRTEEIPLHPTFQNQMFFI